MSGWKREDADALAVLADVRRRTEASIVREVRALRNIGVPWSVIGETLGITKQAAQQHYGKKA